MVITVKLAAKINGSPLASAQEAKNGVAFAPRTRGKYSGLLEREQNCGHPHQNPGGFDEGEAPSPNLTRQTAGEKRRNEHPSFRNKVENE